MKKYLFIALAALGFAACAEKGEQNAPVHTGELEKSYVAITLATSDMGTRAEDELDKKFEDGTVAESAVQSAHVFFFRDGEAFPVSFSNGSTVEDPQGKNHLSLTLTMNDEGDATNSVSDYSNEILVIEKYRGEYPNQVVAVLNWTPTQDNYDIADLQKELLNIQNDEKYFVMCNAVFADDATPRKTIIATPITEANIGTENDLNNLEAVQIYVERLAAKVVFTTVEGGKYDINQTVVDRSGATPQDIKVYAKVEGYELFDAYYDSWLVKQIDPNWSNTELGFTWNDAPNYRCYWADSYTNRSSSSLAFPASNSFEWNTNPSEAYCGENTNIAANDRTKVIVKARLVDENDNAVEVVNWLGKEYVGEDYLKIVVANTLKEKYFSSTDGKIFSSLEPEDLRCVTRDSNVEKAYYVDFQLSTDADYGVNKKWYVKSANGEYNFISYAEMDAQLMDVHPALVYNDGMTYYYTDIRHLANDTTKVGAYGVVRNHVYKVNITNIDGFGTPIYDGSQDFVEVETPEEIYTYVSAQINILSWRIVDRNYDL